MIKKKEYITLSVLGAIFLCLLFVFIFAVLFVEELIVTEGIRISFSYIIPLKQKYFKTIDK